MIYTILRSPLVPTDGADSKNPGLLFSMSDAQLLKVPSPNLLRSRETVPNRRDVTPGRHTTSTQCTARSSQWPGVRFNMLKNITKNIITKTLSKRLKKINKSVDPFKLDFGEDFHDNLRDVFKRFELHPRSRMKCCLVVRIERDMRAHQMPRAH